MDDSEYAKYPMHERGILDDDDTRPPMHEGKYPKVGDDTGAVFLCPKIRTFKQLPYNEFRIKRDETWHA